jgi:hypothetical protein
MPRKRIGNEVIGVKRGLYEIITLEWKNDRTYVKCKCDCGNERIICYSDFNKLSHEQGCGCGAGTHRQSLVGKETRLYRIWKGIKSRCLIESATSYERYGGRGISVCAEWHIYETFRDWAVANDYADNLSIERKNVNGNYEPDNCIWANRNIQARNTRIRKDNPSGVRGVRFHKATSKWSAQIAVNKVLIWLGVHSTFDEAVKVRKDAELKYWGG